jgi:valyl-tRNA synthetase
MLDKKYNAQEKEQKWLNYWNENKIYEFKKDGRKIFSIDTPPPTVNGKIHIGHIFSYSQTEMIARYKRLRGYNIFYPFGFDDNGLPTERYIEKLKGIKGKEMPRNEFISICKDNVHIAEDQFEN